MVLVIQQPQGISKVDVNICIIITWRSGNPKSGCILHQIERSFQKKDIYHYHQQVHHASPGAGQGGGLPASLLAYKLCRLATKLMLPTHS